MNTSKDIVQKVKTFFKEAWTEMRRVSWLSQKEILRYTAIVLSVTIAVAVFLGGLDYLFSGIIRNFLLQ
jgi:preprotein translocase subunit SecE